MTKIEKLVLHFFKMPIEDVIEKLHWEQKISLNEISKRCAISRQSLKNCCERLGIETRGIKAANKLTKNKGKNHFMYGKTKENCELAKKSSIRMKKKNPIHCSFAAEKRARTISKTFSKKLLPQEKQFKKFLDKHNLVYLMQVPFKKYNMDFFLIGYHICIEIDSTAKMGLERRRKAAIRDKELEYIAGIKTIRIDKRKLEDELFIVNILKAHNVII